LNIGRNQSSRQHIFIIRSSLFRSRHTFQQEHSLSSFVIAGIYKIEEEQGQASRICAGGIGAELIGARLHFSSHETHLDIP
jgi:hypothetical protein